MLFFYQKRDDVLLFFLHFEKSCITLDVAQSDFNSAASVGNVLRTEDDQTAVTCATLSVAGALDCQDLSVGEPCQPCQACFSS